MYQNNPKNHATQPKLSVVVLCYKSEELAKSFYTKLAEALEIVEPNFEAILVANYNSKKDRTPEIVKAIATQDPRVRFSAKKKKGMMGWDLRSGLDMARGEYVALIDGDDQFKPELIVKVYKQILRTGDDFVKTKRLRRDDGWFRAIISLFFNLGFLILFGSVNGFYDVNSKPKIMRKSLLENMNLTDSGWFIDAEMMLEVMRLQAKLSEVGVRFYKNKYRDSFVGYGAIIEMVSKLVAYKFKQTHTKVRYALDYWRDRIYWPKTSPAV